MSQNPTENLRRGRRRIEEIPEIILLKDWTWDVVTKRFYLHIRVCLDHDGKDIPRVTEWFVTAETVYPFGTILRGRMECCRSYWRRPRSSERFLTSTSRETASGR